MGMIQLRDIPKAVKMNKINKTWDWLFQKGFINDNKLTPLQFKNINNAWKNKPCYIIGSGPPLKDFLNIYGWKYFDGKHTIGINHVIEDYDKFEWFFFLDKRFLEKTTYNINNFKGRIFAQNTTGLKQSNNITLFTCRHDKPGKTIEEGLYSPNFSGLAALNLAVISGANPIYLIGFGMGKTGTADNYHHKKDYTANAHSKERFDKYKQVQRFYKEFYPYKNRITCATDGCDMVHFKHVSPSNFDAQYKKIEIKARQPSIAHMSFTNDINKMGDVSRELIKKGYGSHTLHAFKDGIPNADIYILEHFISTHKDCVNFPYKKRAIDLVHSVNCIPQGDYGKVITLTKSWENILKKHYVSNIQTITGGIDLKQYENIIPDYSNKVFGRITRWSPGKIPPGWNDVLLEIFKTDKDIKCLMFVDFVNKSRNPLKHAQMIYDETISISDFKGNALKQLSLYVHANGTFKETMSHAVIEAMATGLPVIYLSERTGVLEEVTGEAGIKCDSLDNVKHNILQLINDKDKKEHYGKLSKKQVQKYNVNNFVNNFDVLIKDMLNG